jgi:hypothetical protein
MGKVPFWAARGTPAGTATVLKSGGHRGFFMSNWSAWDWIAYGCLAIAAFGLAAGQIQRETPTMFERLPAFFKSGRWSYVPAILVIVGTAALAAEHFGLVTSRQLAESNTRQERSNAIPQLHISMRGGNIFEADSATVGKVIGVVIDARVWNTGAPTYAVEWSLVASFPSGGIVAGQTTKIPPQLIAMGPAGASVVTSEQALDEKTEKTPVESAPKGGKLLFYFRADQVSREKLLDSATILILSVKDSFDNVTETQQGMGKWLH